MHSNRGMYSFADDSGETAAVQTQNDEPGKRSPRREYR